ncbi:hypothetical protein QR77_32200 [Streptomyces sp. 150FB]|uniref:hypothetical protein n=1 Tax=Streptomyces sp. 150FB TaxID=1576605 RepID=UPI0005890470|nr:hypothetical protein [Streptomyces sp. 150FB]KIF77256.1 hypothetical protein QR77_32200 [Streptomyces sp. 150FB]
MNASTTWRRRRAIRRVKQGDGRPLKRFRWWHIPLGRALFYLRPSPDGRRPGTYAVDVRYWGNQSGGEVTAHLYLDGRHHARSTIPAVFPLEGGVIEVARSNFGIKRCHYVTAEGEEQQLVPDPKSREGKRARFERDHPAVSRMIAAGSVLMLVIGVGLNLLQIMEPISQVPPVAESLGTFNSPIRLPLWLNLTLAFGAALASMERALRLRYHWLLDAGGH